MKTKIFLILILSVFIASCSSLQQTAVNDDLYYSPTDDYVASTDVYSNPTYNNNASNETTSEFDDQITEILEDDSYGDTDTTIYEDKESENYYDRVMVDNYSEAREKRMEAKQSPYYGMATNYNIYFNDDYRFASMFIGDPFYNVVIAGDRVWVEPYYISSSFGYWGRSYTYVGVNSPWYYSSWSRPYYSYYSPYYYNSYYSNPYYHSYYNPYYNPYYYPYSVNNYYMDNQNDNWASSANYSSRRRGLSSMSGSGVNTDNQRIARNPEVYMGRDIKQTNTVKSAIDNNRSEGRAARRTEVTNRRSDDGNINSRRTIRVVDNDNNSRVVRENRQGVQERRSAISSSSARTRSNVRSTINRSTYNANSRTTRYSRPKSVSNTNTVKRSGSGNSNSTYRTNRNTRSNSSGSSRTYTPRRSSGSSGSSGTRSSGTSISRSSGTSSSGSSSTRSSGSSSTRSSGRRR
ncbi:MAG: hypothetical protein R6V16_05545 [Bacteroidales bacterium]